MKKEENLTPKIVWEDVNKIKVATFQPPQRTGEYALSGLLRLIEANGFNAARPLLIAKNGVLGDGHRRLACAKLLGLTQVPVVYTDLQLEMLYDENVGAAKHTPANWLVAYYLGYESPPANLLKMIHAIESVCGEGIIQRLAEASVSPHIYTLARAIARYCNKREDKAFVKRTLEWLLDCKQQITVRVAMRGNIDPLVVMDAIRENRELRKGHWH